MLNEPVIKRHALKKALIFGVLFVIISYLLGFCWETNDDTAIAYILSRLTNDYSPFQWRLLSQILHSLYMKFPVVDWWAVCNVFSIWISAFVYVYVIYQRHSSKMAFSISVLLLVMLWIVALYQANFTRTAAVVCFAGILLIANGLFSAFSRLSSVEYIVGCLLLLHGASIRESCALFALAFLAVIGLFNFLSDHFSFKWSWFQERRVKIFLLCLVPVLFFSAGSLNKAMRTPEQKEYVEYNNLRAAIEDYTSSYPKFEEAPDAYLAAGWDEIDRSVFFDWFSEDTEVFTVESMEQISKLRTRTYDFSSLLKILTGNPEYAALVFATVFLLCCLRKRNWIYGLSSCGMLLLLCVYLVLQGRFMPRVYQSIMLGGVCVTTFLCGGETAAPTQQSETTSNSDIRWLHKTVTTLLFISLAIYGLSSVQSHYADSMGGRDTITQRKKAEIQRAIYDEIDADREHLYIFDVRMDVGAMNNAFTFWEVRPPEYCENRFMLGGWTARAPYRIEQLASYGITNPVRALFERTDVYSLYNERMLDYLRAHYDERITASGTRLVNNKTRYTQFTAPIDNSLIMTDSSKRSLVKEFYYTADNIWYFSAVINDSSDQERIFYCNIDIDGTWYTYRLNCTEDKLTGKLYSIEPSFDPSSAQVRIFEKTEDGYVEYGDVELTVDLLPYMTEFHDCQVTKTNKGLVISGTGIDSQIYFTMPEVGGMTVAGVSVEMDAQAPSVAQLFTQTQKAGFSEKQSYAVRYDAGKVSLALENPSTEPIMLRFDPTMLEGQTIILYSLQLRIIDTELFE